MPELPEVERAKNLVKKHAAGKIIQKVETSEDTIVFTGSTHTEFAVEVRGRMVQDVCRYGKVFYLQLAGEGKMPVLHFGMTGNVIVKGETPLYYKEGPRKGDTQWPPRFMKFILHLSLPDDLSGQTTQIAFVDARRLGRIRLCKVPMNDPPISLLGFDPILNMAPLEDFSKSVLKRGCPVKALLLDQTFSAGVGNWVADEILYHAHVHPEQKCNTLSQEQLEQLHQKTIYVCQTAVSLDADSTRFPEDWLFNYRWGKGKTKSKTKGKAAAPGLMLPSGKPATLKWLTVGGRTSAYVTELQQLSPSHPSLRGKDVHEEEVPSNPSLTANTGQRDDLSDLSSLSELEEDSKVIRTRKRKRQKTT